jgi:DNA-binding MarR family transcriptional regulator
MADGSDSASGVAAELMTAMTRMHARLRSESTPTEASWNWSQVTTLARIIAQGQATTSDLAHAEHVRRQSMADTLAALRASGLITSTQDPTDRRKTLISATPEGHALSDSIPAAREAWLGKMFRDALEPSELQTLLKAAALMNRMADTTAETP